MQTPSLNDNEIQQVLRIFRTNGTGPTVVSKVARQYHIAESVAVDLGKIVTEGADKILHEGAGSVMTETSPNTRSARESHQRNVAAVLVDQVRVAESRESITDATGQDLEALAAAYYTPLTS
jgi:hypothetical protein